MRYSCAVLLFAASLAGASAVFNGPRLFPAPGQSSIITGDFNHDGNLDIAAANSFGHVSVLIGKPDGTFAQAVDYSVPGITDPALAVSDFNGDGKPDLAVGGQWRRHAPRCYSETGANFAILRGDGDGPFLPAVKYPSSASSFENGMVAGDFNHDGYSDIAITVALAAADLNGDGHLDLVVANLDRSAQSGAVAVLLGQAGGTFHPPMLYYLDFLTLGVAIADFNGDGIPDIAAGGIGVSVLVGSQRGSFARSPDSTPSACTMLGAGLGTIAVGDFNGDRRPDIAACFGAASVALLLNVIPP